jgi:hypothetical protein
MAIDPGLTTGLAIATSAGWLIAEVGDLQDVWKVLWAYKPKVILFERFNPQELPVDLSALEVQGIVKLYQLMAKVHPAIWWQPRDVKNLCSDDFLRANSLWVKGMGHGRDAIRHLCWHLIKREGNTELLEWTKPEGS